MITVVFGQFNDEWAWRVEWVGDDGNLQFRDFFQKEFKPRECKEAADAFILELKAKKVA